jgi:hypothetical protein
MENVIKIYAPGISYEHSVLTPDDLEILKAVLKAVEVHATKFVQSNQPTTNEQE